MTGNQFQVGAEIFLFATDPDEIWGLLSLPNKGYLGFLMSGAIPPLLVTSLCCNKIKNKVYRSLNKIFYLPILMHV